MRQTLLPLASLLISCFIMMLGNGLLNILLPVRMGLEAMNTDTIGLILSLYYVGMLVGGIYARHLISRAGHIRMFAGCLALAAVSILICSLYTDSMLWGGMRIVIGFCNACAYTAMESWLSECSTKENRGQVLAFYQVVVLGALFCGQFLINLASPQGTVLFVLSGILLSASIIPIVFSRNSGPVVVEVESMSLVALFKISPLGVVSCFISGVIYSAAFNMLPLFAGDCGIIDFQLSLYMGAAILGGLVLQYPVGYLSDRFDRRTILLIILIISSLAGFSVSVLAVLGWFWPMSVATGITCGIIACTYPLSISETFDRLRQSEMVAAMGCLILTFAIGGIIGPYSTAIIMELFGSSSLFWFLGAIQLLLGVFVAYRMYARGALPVEQQESFVMQSAAAAVSVDMDPRTEYQESEQPLSREAVMATEVANSDPAAAVRMARAVALSASDQGAEIAGAVAGVDGIDVLRFYKVMLEAVPEQVLEITSAIVTEKPECAYDLISHLALSKPDQVIDIANEIGRVMPELRLEMARIAVESAPESAIEVAHDYAQALAVEHDAVRPADREEDSSEQVAIDLVSQITVLVPEQALDIAVTVVEAIPDTAVPVATEYADTLSECLSDESIEEMIESIDHINTPEEAVQELNHDAAEFVLRLSEAVPEQSLDIALAVVAAMPECASEVIMGANRSTVS
ncbi:MAG: MFS family permease [Planctomycetaceae bacterium]|jgi:MFS family permease